MGSLLGRFQRKPSTMEMLEKLEKKISEHQKFRLRTQQSQSYYIGCLILYSIVCYVVGALIFFFLYFPKTWKLRLLYSSPLLLFPILVFLLKKFIHWYFVKRILRNDVLLSDLRAQKRKILEEVMEKETYKKACEILEKFDPDRFKKIEEPSKTMEFSKADSNLRQRVAVVKGVTSSPHSQMSPVPATTSPRPMKPLAQSPSPPPGVQPVFPLGGSPMMRPVRPMMSRPILPRERGNMEKLVDYLVGDGPQNRYALICRQCHSHNGMALHEEFEYLSFRCCYCYTFNAARKQRINAPKIEIPADRIEANPIIDDVDSAPIQENIVDDASSSLVDKSKMDNPDVPDTSLTDVKPPTDAAPS